MDEYLDPMQKLEIAAVLKKMPVMTMRQFRTVASRITGLNGTALNLAVRHLSLNGNIIVSENGYVTTKNAAGMVSAGGCNVRFEGTVRAGRLEPKAFFAECIECFDIILGFGAAAENFTVSPGLYRMGFLHAERNLLYEVVRIPRDAEQAYASRILKDAESTFSAGKSAEMMAHTRRIALVESGAAGECVPYCGFSFICVRTSPEEGRKGYRIAEKRTGDIWRDCRTDAHEALETAGTP